MLLLKGRILTFSKIKELLPEEYEVARQFADVLPGDGVSPAHPFGGFVININVCTKIHRDWHDHAFCLVLVISDNCKDGDLCFSEPGIRLELRSGDMVIFDSKRLSYFNRTYQGEHASIVFHSDGAGKQWVENRNGWAHSLYMNVSNSGGGEL